MNLDKQPVFLLGAGFNVDANAESGAANGAAYPLVPDLAQICFGLSCLPAGKSVEDLLHEAEQCDNSEPMRHFANLLMAADDYSIERLVPYFGATENSYLRFFGRFLRSKFLTFNYDSLPELFLLRENTWCPRDGYGVPLDVEIHPTVEGVKIENSRALVLHLQGSLCIYTSEFGITNPLHENNALLVERQQPAFMFDPGEIASLFHPYLCRPINHDWIRSRFRVIAPIPDKVAGLRGKFIREVYKRGEELLRSSPLPLVAIGYGFGHHDSSSYRPLLAALKSGSASVLLVSPCALDIRDRLAAEFPKIHFEPIQHTLRSWVEEDFPGLG